MHVSQFSVNVLLSFVAKMTIKLFQNVIPFQILSLLKIVATCHLLSQNTNRPTVVDMTASNVLCFWYWYC